MQYLQALSRVLSDQVDRQCIALTEISQGIKATALLPARCVHECKSVDTMSEQQRKFNPPGNCVGIFNSIASQLNAFAPHVIKALIICSYNTNNSQFPLMLYFFSTATLLINAIRPLFQLVAI